MSDVDIIINVATQGAKSITDLSASLRSLNKNLVDLNIPLKKLDAHSQAVAKALGIGARSTNDHAKTLKGLIANQKALVSETKRVRTEIGAYRAAIGFAGASNKKFSDSATTTIRELKAMDRALRGMRLRAFGSDLRATSTRIQKLGKDAQFIGRSLMINLTAPLLLFARTGFQQLLAVDKELIRLTKVLDNVAFSAEQANRKLGAGASPAKIQGLISAFNNLNNELTRISSTYGVSKQLIVGLASDFAELGLNGHESILALTELTAQIEKLGAMDIGGAQDLTQALYFQSVRAYENTGAFVGMTKAIDREAMAVKAATTQLYLFNAIENVTALTLKDLAQAFPEVASMAVSFGLSMTEAAALLAPMKAAGLDVGASANSIKVSLQRALSPTTKNIKILKGLAESFGEAEDATSAFNTATKTGLTGLQSITEIFDKVKNSKADAEGAMKLMSNLFEKRQGPRMYLAIEQLSLFNRELNRTTRSTNTAEGVLAGVAEEALRNFNSLNKTALPEFINNFRDIGIIARIATGHVGQLVEGFVDASGMQKKLTKQDIQSAKDVRKAVADRILLEKQSRGRDIVSEVRTETGRAMIVELAGASNAAQVANAELAESLQALSVVTERLKNNFKLFAADIMRAAVPTLKKLSDKVQELMNKWNNSTEEFRERVRNAVAAIGTFLAALGPVVLAIGTMQSVTGILGRAIAVFIPKLRTETGAFIGLGHAIQVTNAAMAQHVAIQKQTFLTAVKNKLFGKTDLRTPQEAISQITAKQRGLFKGVYDPISKPLTNKEIIRQEQLKELQRRGFPRKILTDKEFIHQEQLKEFKKRGFSGKDFKKSSRIATEIASGKTLSPADYVYTLTRGPQIAAAQSSITAGAAAAKPRIDVAKRQRKIFKQAPLLTRAGVVTDRLGSQFFSAGGTEISERRAGQLATGQLRGRIGLAKDVGISKVKSVATSGKNLSKGFIDAINPVSQYRLAVAGAQGALNNLQKQNALFPAAARGGFTQARVAIMGFVKGIKLANISMKILRMTMLASGIGAAIAIIGIAIFAVMKNMESFKKGAKPLLDALSEAFGQIKQAVILTIQPIMDLFASFGSGGSDGAAAAEGIGAALSKLAGVIKFVSNLIQQFLLSVVRPIFSAIANIVAAVVSMFKGNWGDAFDYLLAALGYIGKAFINIWKMIATATISIITGLAKGIVKLLLEGIVNGLIQGILLAIRGVINLIGKIPIPGLDTLMSGLNDAVKRGGGAISSAISTATDGINKVIDKGGDLAKKGVGKIADGINSVLDKATKKGLKPSILKNKKEVIDAGTELGKAGGEAIANAMGDASGKAGNKVGKAIKDGIADAAQKLQDHVRDAFKAALEKMIDASVAAMKKQKAAALKVFDIQLKTLEKLEKAEESLTKTKEYQQNLRKILDDRDLNRANYVRNRALAIYEGRIDDARMIDLEQEVSTKESVQEETSLKESRRKDLAAENLAALREAIAEAKEKAGELFDLQIEAFEKAAAEIIKIGPVTIEQYTAMRTELEVLAHTSSNKMNEDFGAMFETFVTTIGDKMPNKVVGAFSTSLDLLVAEAQSKYGLGADPSEKTIIGLTIGMLTSIGDTLGDGAPAVIEAFGAITADLQSNLGTAKTEMLLDVKEEFLKPFKKAFDDADPTAVFEKAIKDGNAAILRDFENTVSLNKTLMDKMANNLDPAIKKYIALKAAIDAANDAASGGGAGDRNIGFVDLRTLGFKSADTYEASLRVNAAVQTALRNNAILQNRNTERVIATRNAVFGSDQNTKWLGGRGMKTGGYVSAPTQEGLPAVLHGGEYVLNAKAVNRIGIGALEKMNNNLIPRFKKGGPVPGGGSGGASKKHKDPFYLKMLDQATNISNIKKIPKGIGHIVQSVAQSFSTAGGALFDVIGSSVTDPVLAVAGVKDKSYNPITNLIRRQEAARTQPLNPARGLGFQDKSGMFNLTKDSYLGFAEAVDVATSFGLGPVGKAAANITKSLVSNVILSKVGAQGAGLTVREVFQPAISTLFKNTLGTTAVTQGVTKAVTRQLSQAPEVVTKPLSQAQEVLNQLPRQPVAAPRRLELMPGPKVQPIPLPPVGGFKEQIMDPALVAKKAAFLQAQGMGGGGAAFSNVQQFLDSIGDRANIFGQLRALGIAQAPKASLTGVQRRLVQAYTGSASGALSFETMRRAAPASIEFALFKEILEASSRILGPEMNDFGLPRAISEFSSLPITPAMKPFLDPEVFEQFLKNRSWAILDVAKHIRSPEDLANILNIAAKELENIMETHGITLTSDILLHRGLGMLRGPSNDVLKYVNSAYGIGRSLAPQFRSTSTSDSTARAFTTIKAGDTPLIPLLEHILAPKGTRVFMPDAYGLGLGNEREILLPPRYRLVPSRVDLNVGYKHLDLAEVFGTLAKGVAAGVAAFGGVYGLSGNNKASAYALTEPQKFTEYLKQIRLLSEFIAGGESLNVKDPYSAWFGGKAMMMPDMTSMTINDVIANANNRAVGKYQNMPKYLLARARLANFSGSDLYNESVQEAIMMATLLEKSPVSLGLIDYMTGNMSIDTAVNRIARTWLSMPQLGGAYVGIGANPKGFDRGRKDLVIQAYLNRIKNLYAGFKAGGYVPGSPSMPFPAILHGGEYVVNAGAVRNMGIETMKNINQSKFRTPSGMPLYQSGGQTTTVSTLNINVDTFIGEEEWFKSMMQNYNIHILPRVQKNAGIESRSFKTYNGINQGM